MAPAKKEPRSCLQDLCCKKFALPYISPGSGETRQWDACLADFVDKTCPLPGQGQGMVGRSIEQKGYFCVLQNANGRLFMRRGGKREQEEVGVARLLRDAIDVLWMSW